MSETYAPFTAVEIAYCAEKIQQGQIETLPENLYQRLHGNQSNFLKVMRLCENLTEESPGQDGRSSGLLPMSFQFNSQNGDDFLPDM
ncbi:MAG: hypothetical protein AAF206_24545 [Bacteroidota bacterium]